MRILTRFIAATFLLFVPIASDAAAASERPVIEKLGTLDLDMVETTPIVFNGKLYRFEYVRANYHGNMTKQPYFRFVDVETGKPTPGFALGYLFGSAFVDGDTVYVTGTAKRERGASHRIQVFASKDLRQWESWTALDLVGVGMFNTSVCKADDQYVMMYEIDAPRMQAGIAFTARFATSPDLKTWKVTPRRFNYARDRYTAPHALRYLDGYYYDFYLEAFEGYETRVVRSRDLLNWEPSPLNPVLRASDADKKIANPKLTEAQRERIAKAVNINNSDIDFCEFEGRLIINYSWGNQKGIEHLAEAVYEGTEAEFLRAWFPEEEKANEPSGGE